MGPLGSAGQAWLLLVTWPARAARQHTLCAVGACDCDVYGARVR